MENSISIQLFSSLTFFIELQYHIYCSMKLPDEGKTDLKTWRQHRNLNLKKRHLLLQKHSEVHGVDLNI